MPQTAIHHYFLPRRLQPNKCSLFLALPRLVREKIYVLANLGPDRFIDLNCWAQQRCPSIASLEDEPNPYVHTNLCLQREYEERNPPDPLPVSLLLVCKVVSQEAQELLFGRNCIAISQRNPGGLRALERLSSHAIQALQRLVIHMTPCTCLDPHCTETPRRLPHVVESFHDLAFEGCFANTRKASHDRQLSDISRADRRLLEQWGRICHRLAKHIVPGQLTLHIVCHVKSRLVAEQIIRPLLQLPTLRNCGICLGPSSHDSSGELRYLASIAVQRLTTEVVPALQKPFPFLRLPRELQLQVLADSPLVQDACLCIANGKLSSSGLYHSCDRNSTTIGAAPAIALRGFCGDKCAAFHTGCSHATCATYFTQFSRLGRAFADLATDVFFSQNAFRICTWHANLAWEDKGNLSGMHSFLAGLPSRALRQVRRLDILLPPIGDTSLAAGQPDWKLWQASIQVLATKATLPSLTLTVKIGNYQCKSQRLAQKEHFTTQDERRILQVYEEVVYSLIQLQGLKLFFLYVPCPFGRDNEEARVGVERRLEQMVMGSSYDAYCMGKPQPDDYTRPFLWDCCQ